MDSNKKCFMISVSHKFVINSYDTEVTLIILCGGKIKRPGHQQQICTTHELPWKRFFLWEGVFASKLNDPGISSYGFQPWKRKRLKPWSRSFHPILVVSFISSPGNVSVSLTQSPGRGSGTRLLNTGSQAELLVACSLNFPLKASWISAMVKEHIADPIRPFIDVVNTP